LKQREQHGDEEVSMKRKSNKLDLISVHDHVINAVE